MARSVEDYHTEAIETTATSHCALVNVRLAILLAIMSDYHSSSSPTPNCMRLDIEVWTKKINVGINAEGTSSTLSAFLPNLSNRSVRIYEFVLQ